jgi:hypothetical protein
MDPIEDDMKNKIIILLLLVFVIIGCSKQTNKYSKFNDLIDNRKPISWGQDQVIYVFADEPVWKYAETPLRDTLERLRFTNINESYFEIRRADIKNIDQFFRFRNLIFLGNIDSNLPVATFLKSTLPKKKLDEVKRNKVALYKDQNRWANDQQVLYIEADNLTNLLKVTIQQEETVFQVFYQRLLYRTAYKVYQMPVLNGSYFEGFPFTLQIPEQYQVYKKDIPGNFISFIYRDLHETDETPDKYISVYYEKMKSNQVTQEWLMKKRSEFAQKYYEGDEFKKEDINISQIKFDNKDAWEIYGRWQNQKYKIGGAFQSIAFWDGTKKTAFIIDSSVFYPAGEKLTYLLELGAISNSFKAKP